MTGPKIRSTDADIDDVANWLAGVTLPLSLAHTIGEVAILLSHGMDLRYDIFSVHGDGLPFRGAQGNVQDSPFLRDVDFFHRETSHQCGIANQILPPIAKGA